MATIQCPHCGKRVSESAMFCPHCESPLKTVKRAKLTLKERYVFQKEKRETEENSNIIKCGACGVDVSKQATACPHCGHPVPKPKPPSKWGIFLTIMVVLYGIGLLSGSSNKSNTSSKSTKTYTSSKVNKPEKKRRTTLKGGYFACTSESLFSEMTSAVVAKDNYAIGHLMAKGCVLTKEGVRFSIIDLGIFSGVTKIRAYTDDNSIIMYTNTENILD